MILDDPQQQKHSNRVYELNIPLIYRFDKLYSLFQDVGGCIMRLNGNFKL